MPLHNLMFHYSIEDKTPKIKIDILSLDPTKAVQNVGVMIANQLTFSDHV